VTGEEGRGAKSIGSIVTLNLLGREKMLPGSKGEEKGRRGERNQDNPGETRFKKPGEETKTNEETACSV